MKPTEAVKAISAHARARGQSRIMPRVARALHRLSDAARARQSVTLFVAHEKDAAAARKASGAPKDAAVRVDETLIGGWRVRGGGHLADASYKRALLQLYTRITQ